MAKLTAPETGRRVLPGMGVEEQLAFLNSILESSTEYSIIATGMDRKIQAWNEGARRIYGYTAEEMVGKRSMSDIHCRRDGRTGLRVATTARTAVVVLDLLMPGMDGFDFLRRLRKTPGSRQTPVIVSTVKDLTAKERDRLREIAQAMVQKGDGSTAALLAELEACVAMSSVRPGGGTCPLHDPGKNGQGR